VRRCPYLEEIYRARHGPLRDYRYDCHVDGRTKRKLALSDRPPICVRDFENCRLFQSEKRREDGLITRYTD
jgi:hypothetical protein